jgi:UDP-glucuronate decarboxylase
MKILLTGVAGFLGSHITRSLLNQGHRVIGLDDFSTGRMDNLKEFQSDSNFELIEHDVRNKIDISADYIFNFACPASPVQYQANPVKTIETNILGASNMLQLARKHSSVIIQASTSEIYGDPIESPQSESYWGNVNPIGIRSCYDEGKRAAETLMFDYRRQFSIDSRVIRIFNTYGPKMAIDDGRVVTNFIFQALNGEPLSIYGDGSQTRSFCYVDDLVSGVMAVMQSSLTFDTPINLGNPTETSMIQLANLVIEMTNSTSTVQVSPLPADDPRRRCPDISKAKLLLGWEPRIPLVEGLRKTIAHVKEIMGG